MLFVRNFAGLTGGHLKFADYIEHTAMSGLVRPVLYQTPSSRGVPGNIFNALPVETIDAPRPFPAYFVAGLDWFILDEAGIRPGNAPVVNLIQDFRYADPNETLFACLSRPALRICVSPLLADAVRPHANGDVFVVENGVALEPAVDRRVAGAPARILISGAKNPERAAEVAALLTGHADIDLLTEWIPRPDFLARVAAATIAIMLPVRREGFFLPPLEAMAQGCAVVTPDCSGNLAYCIPGENCLMPDDSAGSLAAAALSLVHDSEMRGRMVAAGRATAARRTMEQERATYLAILTRYLTGR